MARYIVSVTPIEGKKEAVMQILRKYNPQFEPYCNHYEPGDSLLIQSATDDPVALRQALLGFIVSGWAYDPSTYDQDLGESTDSCDLAPKEQQEEQQGA